MDWLYFHELHNMAKSGKKKDRIPQPFFDLGLETGGINYYK